MKSFLLVLFSLTFSSLALAAVRNLTPEQLELEQSQGTAVIDIRTPTEWKQTGVIEGAHKIMFFDEKGRPLVNEFMKKFNQIVKDKNQPFILVCRSGSRTKMVTKFLDEKMGFSHAEHLTHGMNLWIKNNKPVSK